MDADPHTKTASEPILDADPQAEGGVFAMWSDEGPDEDFIAVLEAVFANIRAEVVAFDNPLTGGTSTCTIYICDRD